MPLLVLLPVVRPLSKGSVALPLAAAAARPPLLARLPLALLPAEALLLRRPRLDCSKQGKAESDSRGALLIVTKQKRCCMEHVCSARVDVGATAAAACTRTWAAEAAARVEAKVDGALRTACAAPALHQA